MAVTSHKQSVTVQTMNPILNSFNLDGRLALVTGSSGGIGFALARGLAGAGAHIVLNARREDKLDAAAAALRGEGTTVHAVAFDVTDAAAVANAIDRIEATIGPIEILVNNAGMFLASDASNFVNGHILYVDGGVTATL